MPNEKNILKSNLIFGGSQVVQMITTILRAKLIAIFLGSAGIGFNAIIQSVMLTISSLASCGIMQSSVREMSQAKSSDNTHQLSVVYNVFRKLVIIASGMGLILCILCSWPLSIISLGDTKYTITFIALGLGVTFYICTHGEMAILQGTRNLVDLAKASVIGSLLSLLICIPCYYFLGNNGIIISIIIGYLIFWIVNRYFSSRFHIEECKVTYREALQQGRPMIALGFVLMIGTFMVSLFTYLTNISIRLIGSLNDVGLYQGAASITTQSIVVVIAVLASDFFPRLSALVNDSKAHNLLVNQQISIILSVITPIVAIIICFSDFVVPLLLTNEFLVIVPMLQFMSIALLFRGIWITMSYIILAHGDRKRYLIYDAILGNGLNFLINMIAYYFGGLTFLGVSYVISSIIVCIILYKVSVTSYNFKFDLKIMKTLAIAITSTIATYYIQQFNYWAGVVCMVCIIILSVYNLSTQFDLFSILKIKINKR